MMNRGSRIAAGIFAMGAAMAASAADPFDNLKYAFSGGTPNIDVRLRYEDVDQGTKLPLPPAPLEDATAFTVRTRLGYTTGKWNSLDLQVELENVAPLDGQDYNSCPGGIAPAFGSCNGNTTHAVIADLKGTELNQFWLRYGGIPGTVLKIGRQRLILDNARFIGNVGWRQNEMTYDGASLVNTSLPKTSISYAHLTNANNIFFGNFNLDADLLNVAWTQYDMLNLVGYGYFVDFNKPGVVARPDNKVLGLRATGGVPFDAFKLVYAAEYAKQDDYRDSLPTVVDADYYLGEIGANVKTIPLTAKLGYEVLGSNDGVYGFQTPLATLHAFQGWADQFLVTPMTGIKDVYLNVGYTIEKVALTAVYHDYEADEGSLHYGDEIDLMAMRPINDNLSVTAKYADFSLDENDATSGIALRDTRKIWLQADYKF
jgi:hypothetical protein